MYSTDFGRAGKPLALSANSFAANQVRFLTRWIAPQQPLSRVDVRGPIWL